MAPYLARYAAGSLTYAGVLQWNTRANSHKYRQTSNISRTFVGNQIVDHSDVVGAAPACRRCSNYIFIPDLTHGFNRLCKDIFKARRESFKSRDLEPLVLDILQLVQSKRILCLWPTILGVFMESGVKIQCLKFMSAWMMRLIQRGVLLMCSQHMSGSPWWLWT